MRPTAGHISDGALFNLPSEVERCQTAKEIDDTALTRLSELGTHAIVQFGFQEGSGCRQLSREKSRLACRGRPGVGHIRTRGTSQHRLTADHLELNHVRQEEPKPEPKGTIAAS